MWPKEWSGSEVDKAAAVPKGLSSPGCRAADSWVRVCSGKPDGPARWQLRGNTLNEWPGMWVHLTPLILTECDMSSCMN